MKSLITTATTTVKNWLTPTKKSYPDSIQSFLSGDDLDCRTGTKFLSPYTQSTWIYVATSVLASTVAQLPFRISRHKPKGEEIIETGPVIDLFNNPYPGLDRSMFWQTLISWDCLRGEYFIVPLDQNNRPHSVRSSNTTHHTPHITSLVPLNPDHFAHIVNGAQLLGWRYNPYQAQTPMSQCLLLPEEVIHARTFNPYSFWRGLSPISIAMLAAESDHAAAQFMKAILSNNGDAGLIITTDTALTPEQCEQYRASLRARKRGLGIADQPVFLAEGMKIDKPIISSVDLQFLENRKLNREEIGAIYKVPQTMMGFGQEKSGLSAGTAIEQERLHFIENTITGLCRRLEAAIDPIIKTFGADLHGWFDIDSLPVMQTARMNRLISAERAFGMGVPFNEINEVYQLGFRPLPWGNRGFINQSLFELGQISSVGRVAPRAPQSPETAITRMLELVEQTKSSPLTTPHRSLTSTPKALHHSAQGCAATLGNDAKLQSINPERVESKSKHRRFLFEQRNRALEKLEQEFGFLHVRFQRGETLEPLLEIDRENELLSERIGSPNSSLIDENETRLADLNETIRKGLEEDNDYAELSDRIKRVFQK